jgi:hypothetical protein
MPQPYFTEDRCSHEFYYQVRSNLNIFPIRTHCTKIEEKEKVDVVYVFKGLLNRNVKAVLVQEKAPYPPPFEFILEKDQHDILLLRQNAFGYRAYFYAFFCVQSAHEFQSILGNTVHFDVDKIPPFSSATHGVRATNNPFYVYPNKVRRRGYHLVEILSRVAYCWMGLPRKFFPQLIEDLQRLIEQRRKFYLAIYDKEEKETNLIFNLPGFEDDHDKE